MNRKTVLGFLSGLMIVFAVALPLPAAEQSFDLTMPGCTS